MLVKAGQIIAIDSVKVDPTLSGDGVNSPLGVKAVAPTVSGHAGLSAEKNGNDVFLGLNNNAIKIKSLDGSVEIKGGVQPDGTFEYNIQVSAEPVVSDTKIYGGEGIKVVPEGSATYRVSVSGNYLKPEALNGYATETWVNNKNYATENWTTENFQPKGEYVVPSELGYYYKKTDIDAYSAKVNSEFNETSAWAKSEFQPKSEMSAYYKKSDVYTKSEVDDLIDDFALSADVDTAIAENEVSVKAWAEDTFQVKGNYASATEITSLSSTVDTKLADKADKSYVDVTFQVKGNYVTSADNELSGKALVLKNNKWEKAPEGTTYTQGPNIKITDDFEISGRDWTPELSAKADKSVLNDYTLNSEFETYKDFVNDKFEETSAWALETFQSAGNYLSANALEPYYTSIQVDTIIDGTKSWANNRFQLSGNYLSANALKPYYTSTEVDEAIEEFSAAITDTIIDVSATADDKFLLKEKLPGINGDKVYAEYNDEQNEYVIEGPDIVGNDGISAEFDNDNNEWNIGLSGKPVYMFDKYESDDAVAAGTVIKFAGQNYEQITVDNDGYFELPATAEKVTFNINENVENNNTGLHEYLLNKFALVTDSDVVLVYTQNYYPAEVGSSNGTIAITVDHSVDSRRKYAVVYSGSEVAASANLNFTMSIYSNRI